MVAAALSFWLYSLQPSQGSQGQVPDPVALPLTGHCPGLGVSVWRVGLLDPVAGPSPLMLDASGVWSASAGLPASPECLMVTHLAPPGPRASVQGLRGGAG